MYCKKLIDKLQNRAALCQTLNDVFGFFKRFFNVLQTVGERDAALFNWKWKIEDAFVYQF